MTGWQEEAKALHAEGWGYKRLAKRFSVSVRQVRNVVNPAAAERDRESNRRRNPAKRAWERSEAGRGRCPSCGELKGINGGANQAELCHACRWGQWSDRRAEMVQLRREGLLNVEIAARLGTTTAAVGNALHRERQRDPSIPLSPHYREDVAA